MVVRVVDAGGESLEGIPVGDVEDRCEGSVAGGGQLIGDGVQVGRVDVGERELRALRCELAGQLGTDAVGGTGDHDDFVVVVHEIPSEKIGRLGTARAAGWLFQWACAAAGLIIWAITSVSASTEAPPMASTLASRQ